MRAGVTAVNGAALAGRVILVLEDEPLIALDIMESLRGAGAAVLGAHCLRDALPLTDHPDLAAAILDFGLSDGDAGKICERLGARDIPFVLYSGYQHVSEACRKGVRLVKPTGAQELIGAVVRLLQ
jgi:DNA-binding response OmpR family regulator